MVSLFRKWPLWAAARISCVVFVAVSVSAFASDQYDDVPVTVSKSARKAQRKEEREKNKRHRDDDNGRGDKDKEVWYVRDSYFNIARYLYPHAGLIDSSTPFTSVKILGFEGASITSKEVAGAAPSRGVLPFDQGDVLKSESGKLTFDINYRGYNGFSNTGGDYGDYGGYYARPPRGPLVRTSGKIGMATVASAPKLVGDFNLRVVDGIAASPVGELHVDQKLTTYTGPAIGLGGKATHGYGAVEISPLGGFLEKGADHYSGYMGTIRASGEINGLILAKSWLVSFNQPPILLAFDGVAEAGLLYSAETDSTWVDQSGEFRFIGQETLKPAQRKGQVGDQGYLRLGAGLTASLGERFHFRTGIQSTGISFDHAAVVTKTVRLDPQAGNAFPRVEPTDPESYHQRTTTVTTGVSVSF